jgi:hypothetical protein
MMSADKAQIVLTGTITDAGGARDAQITIQAPGYLAYREGAGRAITFNGDRFRNKSGQLTPDDEGISESLLANFPDAVCLQIAGGGSLRRIGSHFRGQIENAATSAGPYWTVLAFAPVSRLGLTPSNALQQSLFIAIDEQTQFISDVRNVVNVGPTNQNIIQTQFSNWSQQNGQWFPRDIVRLENGKHVLSFRVQQINVGAAAGPSTFEP